MSTNQAHSTSSQAQCFDDPIRRLLWTLPSAVVIWMFLLALLSIGLSGSNSSHPQPSQMQAELIEQVELAAQTKVTPPPKVKIESSPAQIAPPLTPTHTRNSASLTPLTSPLTTPSPTSLPNPAPAPLKPNSEQGGQNVNTETNTTSNTAGPQTTQSAARALLQPMPQIPDSLREEALQAQAIARFTISVDGAVSVEWVKPTQNPTLNRLLLSSLTNWKFFPALKDGHPIASTQEIVIKVQVK